jgi:hypothetical protein
MTMPNNTTLTFPPYNDDFDIPSLSRHFGGTITFAAAMEQTPVGRVLGSASPGETVRVDIADYWVNIPPTQRADIILEDIRTALASHALGRLVVEPRITPFERRRAERGHPVKKQVLAADWQPNAWEA